MYIDVAAAVTVWKPCSEDCIQLSLYYTIPIADYVFAPYS